MLVEADDGVVVQLGQECLEIGASGTPAMSESKLGAKPAAAKPRRIARCTPRAAAETSMIRLLVTPTASSGGYSEEESDMTGCPSNGYKDSGMVDVGNERFPGSPIMAW